MNIEQGLFQFDLTDYHSILGVALDADAKQIRKRYLNIARKLHPDSLLSATEEEKQQAHELLSKLVNPAYEKLTQEKSMTEHQVVLRLRGQQLSRQKSMLNLQTDAAKSILKNNNPISLYRSSVQKLAEQQYESLGQVLSVTGEISELNLAYLVSTNGNSATAEAAAPEPVAAPAEAGTVAPVPLQTQPRRRHREAIIDSYLNRAREFELKKDYSRAILELREAVKAHPNNADCHSQLAKLYLQAGQPTMSRIHLKRALDIDPNNETAKQLEPTVNKVSQSKTTQSSTQSTQNKSKGGLFGLFGGKQK